MKSNSLFKRRCSFQLLLWWILLFFSEYFLVNVYLPPIQQRIFSFLIPFRNWLLAVKLIHLTVEVQSILFGKSEKHYVLSVGWQYGAVDGGGGGGGGGGNGDGGGEVIMVMMQKIGIWPMNQLKNIQVYLDLFFLMAAVLEMAVILIIYPSHSCSQIWLRKYLSLS